MPIKIIIPIIINIIIKIFIKLFLKGSLLEHEILRLFPLNPEYFITR